MGGMKRVKLPDKSQKLGPNEVYDAQEAVKQIAKKNNKLLHSLIGRLFRHGKAAAARDTILGTAHCVLCMNLITCIHSNMHCTGINEYTVLLPGCYRLSNISVQFELGCDYIGYYVRSL